ncbi:MAG: Tol-Pal system beta propeller repeat protein TolB [bacterium]|nr:Tol-Pal system beta propeller repeat protein TolB [bacterium]
MKRFFVLILFVFSLAIPQKGSAAIYILVDQFSPEQKFPIAIGDIIYKKDQAPNAEGKRIANILRRNMKLAGYFDLVKIPTSLNNSPAVSPEDINFEAWKATGARVFVKGNYKGKGKKITLELRLYDPQLGTMLVGKQYKVKRDKAYAAIHRFADEIMLALTGQRGIFNTKIAAACGPKGKEQIVVMNVDGTDRVKVTDNHTINLSPTWDPAGTELVFTSYMKYFPELYLSQAKKKGWGRPKRLTFNNTMNITPDFSPDGEAIALSSSMAGEPDLHLIDRTGKKLGMISKAFGIDISPSWSPDGRFIAFASERAGNLHIFVTNRNGGKPKRLTFTGYQNDTPAWSPRGDKIAFVKRAGGGFNIFTMNADGTQADQLTTAGNNENPSWSPDGRYMVFSSSRKRGSNLFLMMWDGSNQTAITTHGLCKTPDWSPWLDQEEDKKKKKKKPRR